MGSEFWSHWIWPLVTAILGSIFTVLLVLQYSQRRKKHQLAWSIGFLFYSIAAFMEAYSEFAQYWDPTLYRFYYVMAASLVAFLGLGTIYLVFRKPVLGNLFLAYILIVLAAFLYSSMTADLITANLVPGITVGGTAMPGSVRIYSFLFTIPGTLALIGGSIYSIIHFAVKRGYEYRVWANVLIIVGTLVIAGAGSMARTGQTVGLYPAEMLGAAFLLWGFLMASTLRKGAITVANTKVGEQEEEIKAPELEQELEHSKTVTEDVTYEQVEIFDIDSIEQPKQSGKEKDTGDEESDDTLF